MGDGVTDGVSDVLEVEDVRTRLEGDLDAAQAMLARYAAVQDAVATGAIPGADVDAERLRATLELNTDIILAIAKSDDQRRRMLWQARAADDVVEGGFVMLPRQAADAPTTMNGKAGVLQL